MRALAIFAVIAAHAHIPGAAGGFVGVDVFFVISGFLITRLLLAEIDRTGRIDLPAFWLRRAHRLLPNAYAALLGTVLIALFLFPGYNSRQLTQEITLAALQIANFHFAHKAVDYFQADEPASPILHFWSLNVEEQFYIVWPLLLLGVLAWGGPKRLRNIIGCLVVIWAVSLAASLILTKIHQPYAYFTVGPRCWQLATGGLLAACWKRMEQLPNGLRAFAAWAGLAAIAGSTLMLDDTVSYPGLWALLPTLGSAGLLAGFGATRVQGALRRGLSHPVMLWIGERSYSWYLWHWPLLALPRAAIGDSAEIALIAVPLSLLVAAAAHRWIEGPLRRPKPEWHMSRSVIAGTAALGIVIGAGHMYKPALLFIDADLAKRADDIQKAASRHNQAKIDNCFGTLIQPGRCEYGDVSANRSVVLFGDSHALHWFPAIDAAARQTGWALKILARPSCPSAHIELRNNNQPDLECTRWRHEALAALTGEKRPELVIISNRTDYYGDIYAPGTRDIAPDAAADQLWRDGFREVLRQLLSAGLKVAVIRDVPRAPKAVKACVLTNELCDWPRRKALALPALDAEVAAEFKDSILFADFTDRFCDAERCPGMLDDILRYQDSNHITVDFASTFAPQMTRLLSGDATSVLPQRAMGD